MKNCFRLTMFSWCTFLAIACLGRQPSIYWGTNTLGVVFDDPSLSLSVKEIIVEDLERCFLGWGGGAEVKLRNKAESVGYLDYGTVNPYYPESVLFPGNLVTNTTGGVALQVSKRLNDAYTNSMVFFAVHTNAVAEARAFVEFVSSTNFQSVNSSQIADYVLFKDADPTLYLESFVDITNSLRKQKYYPFSILGFHYSSEGPDATNLWLNVPSTSTTMTGEIQWSPFPVIWHEGKWKFSFWDAQE